MSVVKKYHVKPRLAEMIQKAGGLHVGEAIKRGQAVIDEHREEFLSEIDAAMAAMDALAAQADYDIEEMYKASTRVISACAVLTDESLAQASRSLCDLIDRASETGKINPLSVQVHLASMRMLHRSEASPDERAQILEGLTKVVEKQDRQAAAAQAKGEAEAASDT
ncbi:hypothetical protein [Phenylobacterium aquaticum]|uniref:hypothetical protein n=1 Tax=Phenylobacterium aquaticum TaxID=1763816 RepID=UPI001F5D89CD|nr:hypothetical protein [Phenylobacterium aquaticum]MCI3132089.1 hypothetical protein [Phenylobacterium aquaticum]